MLARSAEIRGQSLRGGLPADKSKRVGRSLTRAAGTRARGPRKYGPRSSGHVLLSRGLVRLAYRRANASRTMKERLSAAVLVTRARGNDTELAFGKENFSRPPPISGATTRFACTSHQLALFRALPMTLLSLGPLKNTNSLLIFFIFFLFFARIKSDHLEGPSLE